MCHEKGHPINAHSYTTISNLFHLLLCCTPGKTYTYHDKGIFHLSPASLDLTSSVNTKTKTLVQTPSVVLLEWIQSMWPLTIVTSYHLLQGQEYLLQGDALSDLNHLWGIIGTRPAVNKGHLYQTFVQSWDRDTNGAPLPQVIHELKVYDTLKFEFEIATTSCQQGISSLSNIMLLHYYCIGRCWYAFRTQCSGLKTESICLSLLMYQTISSCISQAYTIRTFDAILTVAAGINDLYTAGGKLNTPTTGKLTSGARPIPFEDGNLLLQYISQVKSIYL